MIVYMENTTQVKSLLYYWTGKWHLQTFLTAYNSNLKTPGVHYYLCQRASPGLSHTWSSTAYFDYKESKDPSERIHNVKLCTCMFLSRRVPIFRLWKQTVLFYSVNISFQTLRRHNLLTYVFFRRKTLSNICSVLWTNGMWGQVIINPFEGYMLTFLYSYIFLHDHSKSGNLNTFHNGIFQHLSTWNHRVC